MKGAGSTVKSGKTKAQYTEAFSKWKKENPKEPQTRAAFLKAKPEYEKSDKPTSSGVGESLSLTATFEYLALHQEIIVEPSAGYHM